MTLSTIVKTRFNMTTLRSLLIMFVSVPAIATASASNENKGTTQKNESAQMRVTQRKNALQKNEDVIAHGVTLTVPIGWSYALAEGKYD